MTISFDLLTANVLELSLNQTACMALFYNFADRVIRVVHAVVVIYDTISHQLEVGVGVGGGTCSL